MQRRRIIVGITGASGVIYGVRAMRALAQLPDVEIHLIFTAAGKRTLLEETDFSVKHVEALAHVVHHHQDIGSPIASGSFRTAGMLVAPCSIKSLSAIAYSYDATLITRAADVCLKERRPLVLMVRETPLHQGHLETMAKAASYGAIIAPPVPAFYSRPTSLEDVVDHTIGRAFDAMGIDHELVNRWKE